MEYSILFYFFGGVLQDSFSWKIDFEQVLFELARWLLPIGVCLLVEGLCLEKWRKIEPLSCYRYETVKIWWKRKFLKILSSGISVAAVLLIMAIAVDIVSAVGISGEVWKVIVLWLAHIMTIMSLFTVLDLTKFKRLAPAMLLLLEGFTFLVGFRFHGMAQFMYGMWGMYFQSEWYYGERGVVVLPSLIAEGILLVLSYLAGGLLLENAKDVKSL